MKDIEKIIDDLRNSDEYSTDHRLIGICYRAANAIEFLIKDRDDWKEAAISASKESGER